MLQSTWPWFILRFLSLPVPFLSLCWPFHVLLLQTVSLLFPCSTVFFSYYSTLADGFSLASEFQQIFFSLSDYSSYSSDLNNAEDCMVSACLLISKLSSSFTNPLTIVPSAPIIIIITVTIKFCGFLFSSLTRSKYLSLSFFFFYFYSVVRKDGKVYDSAGSLFFFDYHKSRVAEIK